MDHRHSEPRLSVSVFALKKQCNLRLWSFVFAPERDHSWAKKNIRNLMKNPLTISIPNFKLNLKSWYAGLSYKIKPSRLEFYFLYISDWKIKKMRRMGKIFSDPMLKAFLLVQFLWRWTKLKLMACRIEMKQQIFCLIAMNDKIFNF